MRPPHANDTVWLYRETIDKPLPIYHLPGYLRDTFDYDRTICGIPTADAASHLPLRLAHRIARLCSRCQTFAGILITDTATPGSPITIHESRN